MPETKMWYEFFGLKFEFDPVAFTVPGTNWKVYWYGILITIGFVLAVIYGMKRATKLGVNADRLMDCVLVTAPLAILGARAYYIIFDESISFKQFFNIHDGGLAILGGVIVAAIVGTIMCLIRKVDVLSALDITALGFLIGQSIGRWGNFINQEAYGELTGSTWFGISGEKIVTDTKIQSTMPVHPCFLYESVWCALGFVILHFMSKKRKFKGQIAASYMVWYGFGRFFIEYLRTDSLMQGNVRVSMLLSGLMFVIGIIILAIGFVKSSEKEEKNKVAYATTLGIDKSDAEDLVEETNKSESIYSETESSENTDSDSDTDTDTEE